MICHENGTALQVTVDHQPIYASFLYTYIIFVSKLSKIVLLQADEQKRILESGGFVAQSHGVWRVGGILAVSRAIGNYHIKDDGFVVSDPDIYQIDLNIIK